MSSDTNNGEGGSPASAARQRPTIAPTRASARATPRAACDAVEGCTPSSGIEA